MINTFATPSTRVAHPVTSADGPAALRARPVDAYAACPARPGAGCAASTGHSKWQTLAPAPVPASHPGAREGRAAPAHATDHTPNTAIAAARSVASPADVAPASAAHA